MIGPAPRPRVTDPYTARHRRDATQGWAWACRAQARSVDAPPPAGPPKRRHALEVPLMPESSGSLLSCRRCGVTTAERARAVACASPRARHDGRTLYRHKPARPLRDHQRPDVRALRDQCRIVPGAHVRFVTNITSAQLAPGDLYKGLPSHQSPLTRSRTGPPTGRT